MSEEDKKIIKNVSEAIPEMSEFEKGYLLGMVEAKRAGKTKHEDKKELVAV